MQKPTESMAKQIADAATILEKERSGLVPKSVSVVHSDGTLVITLHAALSPAELALSKTPEGAAKVQEFHRQLFASDSLALRNEIRRITGVEVRQAVAEVEPASGTLVAVFTTGTIVQVFLLARGISDEKWNKGDADGP